MTLTEKARILRAYIEKAAESLSDSDAAAAPELFPAWKESGSYSAGNRVRYGDTLYKCLQAHEAQPAWTPKDAPSLWARTDDPAEEWPEWVQPTGATDAYENGAKVSHGGKKWTSIVAANVWEPGVYGWNEATE